MKNEYTITGEWSEQKITESKTGFVVTITSRIQGTYNGCKLLLPYSDKLHKGIDLSAMWNEHMNNAQAIAERATKTLKRGGKVT